jgi:nucleotide-binding universal stress UspA family protein
MQGGYKRLVAPMAGSGADDRVLGMVVELLGKEGGVVTFLYVVQVPQSMPLDAELPGEVEAGEQALRRAVATVRKAVPAKSLVLVPELLQARAIGPAIVDEAIERGADAIVMSANIHRRHGRSTIGETTNHVLLNAPCEVILIRVAPADNGRQGVARP